MDGRFFKRHLFFLANKQRHGGRVKCLRKNLRVFRKPGHKNGKEAIFVALYRVPAPASIAWVRQAHPPWQRLRRPSNPASCLVLKKTTVAQPEEPVNMTKVCISPAFIFHRFRVGARNDVLFMSIVLSWHIPSRKES